MKKASLALAVALNASIVGAPTSVLGKDLLIRNVTVVSGELDVPLTGANIVRH